jgi:hypothetical protein
LRLQQAESVGKYAKEPEYREELSDSHAKRAENRKVSRLLAPKCGAAQNSDT